MNASAVVSGRRDRRAASTHRIRAMKAIGPRSELAEEYRARLARVLFR